MLRAGAIRRISAGVNPIMQSGQLASFPYHQDASKLPQGEALQPYEAFKITQEANKALGSSSIKCSGVGNGLIHSSSGLVAYVFRNLSSTSTLVFGGTTAGQGSGTLMQRSVANAGKSAAQWGANIKNGVGGLPQSYREAEALLSSLIKISFNPKVKVLGHSLGGALATYAAARCGQSGKPIYAIGFCSAELGRSAIKQIQSGRSEQELESILSRIEHIFIQGDPVSQIGRVLPGLQHLGITKTIQPAPGVSGGVAIHDQFIKSIEFNFSS